MSRISVGEIMPDFTFDTTERINQQLSEVIKAAPKTMLLFLRYYGCPICQFDIHEIQTHFDRIKATGGQLYVVLQSERTSLLQKLEGNALSFPIICDPDQSIYKLLSIEPAPSMEKMGDARTMELIQKVHAAGYQHGEYEGNELQLPACFVLDKTGKTLHAHYGVSAGDFPTVDEMVELLS